jgi:hypothetical protein
MEAGLLIVAGGFLAALVILPGAALAGFLGMRQGGRRGRRPLI